jgi:hypothetical protein
MKPQQTKLRAVRRFVGQPKLLPVWVFLGVCALWAAFGLGAWFSTTDKAKAGQFGDTFGAVNALFSGLAFAGVIVALWYQGHELALQRQSSDLSAYLNAAACVLAGLEKHAQTEEGLRSGPSDTAHRMLLGEIELLLLDLRKGASSVVVIPDRLTIAKHKIAALATSVENALNDKYINFEEAATHLRAWVARANNDVKYICETLSGNDPKEVRLRKHLQIALNQIANPPPLGMMMLGLNDIRDTETDGNDKLLYDMLKNFVRLIRIPMD